MLQIRAFPPFLHPTGGIPALPGFYSDTVSIFPAQTCRLLDRGRSVTNPTPSVLVDYCVRQSDDTSRILVSLRRQTTAEEVDQLHSRLSQAGVELALLRLQLQQRESEYDALRTDVQTHRADDAVRRCEQVGGHSGNQCTHPMHEGQAHVLHAPNKAPDVAACFMRGAFRVGHGCNFSSGFYIEDYTNADAKRLSVIVANIQDRAAQTLNPGKTQQYIYLSISVLMQL